VRSGLVAVVGRPNVGKSTLVNRLIGHKVAITSSRPQTTRNVIRGVVTRPAGDDPEWQMVLIDTPGLHKPRTALGNRLNLLVQGSLAESDIVAFVIDATAAIGPGDRLIAGRLQQAGSPVVVVVNKVDAARPGQLESQLSEAGDWDFAAYAPVSAKEGEGIDTLESELVRRLPEGPLYFPPDMWTDQADEHMVAEIIREKFLERLREELPHSLAVVVEDMTTREDGLLEVAATAVVERRSQKGIIIGEGGSMLEAAGTEARKELETFFGTRVHLALRVRVEPDWQRRPAALDRLRLG
jgi:GTPase